MRESDLCGRKEMRFTSLATEVMCGRVRSMVQEVVLSILTPLELDVIFPF